MISATKLNQLEILTTPTNVAKRTNSETFLHVHLQKYTVRLTSTRFLLFSFLVFLFFFYF